MIDATPEEMGIVDGLLSAYVPRCEVRAFGSRAKWEAKDHSDLDLVVKGESELDRGMIADLKDAFAESDLRFRVDVVDWHAVSDTFRDAIEGESVTIREGEKDAWREMTLGECGVVVNNTVSPTELGDTPYIGLEHIGENTLSLLDSGSASDVTSAKSRIRRGDILFGKLRPYFRKVVRAPFDGICSTDIWVINPKEGVDAGYLFYLMASQEVVDFATQGSIGTKMPRAKWDHVGQYPVKLPPLPEQRRIAQVLGTLDDKIELNRRMNETLEEMARAVFKDWFVDFGPVRAKMEGREAYLPEEVWGLFPDRLVDSELGSVPEGWGVKALDEIANYRNGLALQKFRPEPNEERLPVVKIAQLRSGVANSGEWASANITPECVIEDGDVVFSWSGSLLVIVWTGGRAALNQHLFKVTSRDYPKWFYLHFTKHHLAEFQSIAADKTTTMGHIKRQHLKEAKCAVPPHEILEAASDRLESLLQQSILNDVASRRLSALRDGLLPRLVTGELPLD